MRKFKKKLLLFLYASLLIVVGSFTVLLINYRKQVRFQAENLVIEKNIIQADSLISNVIQLESDKRGFQLTTDISFLKNIYQYKTGCERNIRNLRKFQLDGISPGMISQIDSLVRLRQANLDSGILLFRSEGPGSAVKFMQQLSGKNTRELLVGQLQLLKSSYLAELEKNTADINIRNERNVWGLVIILVIFILLILVTASSVKRVQYKMIKNHLKFKEAQRIAKIGSWEWDFSTGKLKWSQEQFSIFGEERGEFDLNYENYLTHLEPEERTRMQTYIEQAIVGTAPFAVDHVITRKDGTKLTVYEQGTILFDLHGKPVGMFGTTQDITTQKKAEEEIKAERKLLRTLIDNIPDPIYIKDASGRKIMANKSDMAFMGVENTEEFLGKTDIELFPGDTGVQGHNSDLEVMSGQIPVLNRLDNFTDSSKNEYWLLASKIPLFDTENNLIGLLGIGRDISKRIRAEQELAETQKKFEAIFSNSAEGIYQSSPEGRFIIANQSMAKIFGYTNADEMIQSITDIGRQIYADPLERVRLSELLRSTGHVENHEFRVVRKDGAEIWVSANIRMVRDKNGVFQYFEGTLEDISERKTAEEHLMSISNRLQVAVAATNIGIWDWDLVKDITVWDEKMYQLYDIEPGEYSSVSAAWESSLYPEDRNRVLELLRRAINGEEEFDTEFRIISKDDSLRYIKGNAVVVRDQTGIPLRMIGTNGDITARKNAEQEILQLNKSLEQFANITAHDLQEPIRMVSGFLGLLDKKYRNSIDEQGQMFIHRAKDGADRMTILIRDLLEFSRSGNKNTKKEPVDLNYVLDLVYKDMGIVLEDTAASLLVPNSLPIVEGSQSALYRLFLNLVSNGLKFRKKDLPPEVKLDMKEFPDAWEFTVRDNGIGVKETDKHKLFQAFQRLHKKEDYPGTGLGLVTCKKIVEIHGGRIWMNSEFGKGTEFHFTLPKMRA
jgi:PAS domain S-box-containing protein